MKDSNHEKPDFRTDEKERILLVDDEAGIRRLFFEVLSGKYICVEAASYKEASVLLNKHSFALVITDILMPDNSGIDLLKLINENFPNTAVIIASGIGNAQFALETVRFGAFDYLIKPCDLSLLELTVQRAISRRRLKIESDIYKRELEYKNAELTRRRDEMQKMQAQLIYREKMSSLGQLVAGIAHEINNPVSFIYGNLDIFKNYLNDLELLLEYYDSLALSEKTASRIKEIKNRIDYKTLMETLNSLTEDFSEGADRITKLVKNLSEFSRLDEVECTKTDINLAIDSTIGLISHLFLSKNVNIVRNYGNIPPVEASAGQLKQVFMNLLTNAVQSVNHNTGEVSIKTFAENDYVTVEIKDNGVGIAPKHLTHIFEPFYTTKPVGQGMGLGLSVAFGIVKRHHGNIFVTSEPHRETVFTVCLPTVRNKEKQTVLLPELIVTADNYEFGKT